MKWSNQIRELIGIDYPIIQAPMFGVTTPEMVIAASRAGALGSLSLGDLPAECGRVRTRHCAGRQWNLV